jgi:glycosyltransferase involved in cell wall biosynthesis
MRKMKISVVIETDSIHDYDDIKIEACLKAVADQTYPREQMEYVLVDGGKVPNLDEIVARILPTARILKLPESTKFQQKNLGIKSATGEIIAFIDGDCAAPSDWIERIAFELSEAAPEVAGLQGITVLTKRALSKEISALFYGPRKDGDQNHSARLVTDNCAFRREALTRFGFEHSEFSTVSDTLLLLRLRKAGYRMLISEGLRMNHSFPGFNRHGIGWFFGRAYGVGYYMVKARQVEPDLRGSSLVRFAGGIGWPLLAAAKWILDIRQILQNRRRLQARLWAALPLTVFYHPTLFFGGLASLLRFPAPKWQ